MPNRLPTIIMAVLSCWSATAVAQTPTSYTATWASVDQHPPAPEWYKDGKLGIWFHWGVFSVPAHYSEWYPHYMYDKSATGSQPGAATNGADSYLFNKNTFGDPFADWPYDKFITGGTAKNGKFVQFAPKLPSDGGNFDPDAWAQLFIDAGARFAGPVMEHHDGFSMWDSKVNEWNSADKGPKLNLAKLHVDAYRKRGLKVFAALHHAYNFMGYWQFVPMPTDQGLKKLYGKLSTSDENQLWYDKLKEVVDEFQPDILYQDASLNQIVEAKRLQFLAYYYNAALSWNKEVVATYKDGFNNKGEVFSYERGGPADILSPYWQTDDTISQQSWGYIDGLTYYSEAQIVHTFIDRVSKNGNLMLNISPMADGTIPQAQQQVLKALGTFLKQFGTAIYSTRAWVVYGEGPTKMGGGTIQTPTAGNANDVRYTTSKDGDAVYAILLGWPGNGKQVNLTAVTPSRFTVGSGKVFLFAPIGGSATSLPFTQDSSGLHVSLPSTQPYTALAYAMKISKSGTEPGPTPTIDGGSSSDAGAGGAGGDAGVGGQTGTGGAGGATTTSTGSGGTGAGGGALGGGGRTGTGGAGGATTTSMGSGGTGPGGGTQGGGGSGATTATFATGGAAGGGDTAARGGTSGNNKGGSSAGSTGGGGGGQGGSEGVGGGPANATGSGCSCQMGRPSVRAGTLGWVIILLTMAIRGGRRSDRKNAQSPRSS
jgi:alpha-L-fucosidase